MALGPDHLGARTECGCDLRAELLALDQGCREQAYFLDADAVAKITQALAQAKPGRQLADHLHQLLADRLAVSRGLLADQFYRFEQSQTRLHADHDQIKDVGKLLRDT